MCFSVVLVPSVVNFCCFVLSPPLAEKGPSLETTGFEVVRSFGLLALRSFSRSLGRSAVSVVRSLRSCGRSVISVVRSVASLGRSVVGSLGSLVGLGVLFSSSVSFGRSVRFSLGCWVPLLTRIISL